MSVASTSSRPRYTTTHYYTRKLQMVFSLQAQSLPRRYVALMPATMIFCSYIWRNLIMNLETEGLSVKSLFNLALGWLWWNITQQKGWFKPIWVKLAFVTVLASRSTNAYIGFNFFLSYLCIGITWSSYPAEYKVICWLHLLICSFKKGLLDPKWFKTECPSHHWVVLLQQLFKFVFADIVSWCTT